MDPRRRRRPPRVLVTLAAAGLVLTSGLVTAAPSGADDGPATYTNPVSTGFTRDFADPTIIRGRDGWYYAYATNGRRQVGQERQLMMISRSRDLVDWQWVGPVFTPETMPRYDGQPEGVNRQFWAPEITYLDGRYVLYYSYVVNTPGEEPFSVIAAATSDHPAGPWTDSGSAVVGPERWEPRPGVSEWRNVIDPEVVTTPEGTRYLYYGSVLGGVRVVELSEDGLSVRGEVVQLTPEHRFEAAYVVHREGWYYLFLSEIGGCCAGAASGYPVVVARSRDPVGPFLDRAGVPVSGRYAGGTPVLSPNGNAFVSTGHNAVATDVSGQDWLVTHALDRDDPYLDGRANSRQLAITRLDWIDGWPVGDAGRGIPEGPVPAPATGTLVADDFEDGTLAAWRATSGWTTATETAGGFARTTGRRELRSRDDARGDLRLRATVRLDPGEQGRAGLTLPGRGRHAVSVWIDRDRGELVLQARDGSGQQEGSAPLPPSFDHTSWHELEITRRGSEVVVALSDAGQHDPVATTRVTVEPSAPGPVALQASGTAADFDDVTVAPLYEPVTARVPAPEVGALDPAAGDEFDGALDPAWQWLREPAAAVSAGGLDFDLQSSTLIDQRPRGGEEQPSLLLRDMPEGTWTAETKVTVPFGDSLPFGWPQAGLVAHASDDDWVGLGYTTRVSPRFVAFARELPAPDGEPVYGHAALGPAADTMWLRLHHTVDEDGGHLYRAATSTDGQHWVWHGVRVMPAGPQPRVGLLAMDLDEGQPPLTARFEWFRVYR